MVYLQIKMTGTVGVDYLSCLMERHCCFDTSLHMKQWFQLFSDCHIVCDIRFDGLWYL